jgi:hypothetical protein
MLVTNSAVSVTRWLQGPAEVNCHKFISRVDLLRPFVPTQMDAECDTFPRDQGATFVVALITSTVGQLRREDAVTVGTMWRRKTARALALVIITAFISLPAAASDTATNTQNTPKIKASMEKIVARAVAATPSRKKVVVRTDSQAAAAGTSPGFFKTTPGIVALAVMAAGTGYALYSTSHDRIHSPGKQ